MIIISFKGSAHEQTRFICRPRPPAPFCPSRNQNYQRRIGTRSQSRCPCQTRGLAFYYPDYIAVTGADKFKNVIGISREFWEKFNPGSWAMFKQKLPTLQNIADIGNISTGTFSLEKTLALKPDVLILADWQYKAIATHLPRIKAAGIPVVVVDFNAETVARHTRSAEIFGELNGTQARAQKIAAEYARGIADIQKRVARAKQSKTEIYIEFGRQRPVRIQLTPYGKDMWARLPTQQAATISPRLTLKTGDR